MNPDLFTMEDKKQSLSHIFMEAGLGDFRWIAPADIVVRQWVRLKCTFGCPAFGKKSTCPPNTPSVEECERFFREYGLAAVFHLQGKVIEGDKSNRGSIERNKALVKLERQVFLTGYHRAFMMVSDPCFLCDQCGKTKEKCKLPRQSRPSPEAMAVDVYATVRQLGFHVEVLTDRGQEMDRFGILMIE